MATPPHVGANRSEIGAGRAAIGTTSVGTRADIGANRSEIGANRSEIGDHKTVEQLRALARQPKARATLTPRPALGAIPARTGVGLPEASGGIASPLVETDYLKREYYEMPQMVTSSDGLFVIEQQAIKRVYMLDANGAEVVLEFAEPKQPPEPEE